MTNVSTSKLVDADNRVFFSVSVVASRLIIITLMNCVLIIFNLFNTSARQFLIVFSLENEKKINSKQLTLCMSQMMMMMAALFAIIKFDYKSSFKNN